MSGQVGELPARGEVLITRTWRMPLPADGGKMLLGAGERWGGDTVGEGRAASPLPRDSGRLSSDPASPHVPAQSVPGARLEGHRGVPGCLECCCMAQ